MANVKYLSYDGLQHYTEKLFKIIEENERVTAEALTDLNTRLNEHTHESFDDMVCFNNDIHLCNNGESYGGTIYFGDNTHDGDALTYIRETTDDKLEIYAKSDINIVSGGNRGNSDQEAFLDLDADSNILKLGINGNISGMYLNESNITISPSDIKITSTGDYGTATIKVDCAYPSDADPISCIDLTADIVNSSQITAPGLIHSNIDTASRSSYFLTADGGAKPIGDIMSLADAMVFKGTITSNSQLPATHKHGWTYRINTAGTYAGQTCEVGDLIICITDGTSKNDSHWTVAQTNTDGVVSGPT